MQEAGQDRQERTSIVQALGSAIGIATFCYFILCFILIFVFSRASTMPLIYYFSLEDYLKAGIEINLPIAVMLALIILLFRAVYYSAPKNTNDTVLIAIVKEQTQRVVSKYLLVLISIGAIWEFLIKVHLSEDSEWRMISLTLFWLIAGGAFVFSMLSIRAELLLLSVVLVMCIAANIWAGHLAVEAFQRGRANIAITLIDDPNHPISGVLIMPASKGIIYLAAELCEQPKDNSFRFVSWEAVSRVQTVSSSAEDCALPSDRWGAPIR